MNDHTEKPNKNKSIINLKTLKERKHKQLDLFIADNFSVNSFRDEMASMEHSYFALKVGDTRIREYISNDKKTKIVVNPNAAGVSYNL